MAEITASVVIKRPIQEVFAYVSNFENDTQWWLGVIESRVISDIRPGVGTQYWQLSKFLGRRNETIFVITEYEPVTRIALQSLKSAIPFVARYTLETTGNNETCFTMHAQVTWLGFYKLIQPFFNFMMQRFADKFFNKLKQVLEYSENNNEKLS